MATTVTYKGNTLTSLGSGDTKTLQTSGKYLEDNIIITNNIAPNIVFNKIDYASPKDGDVFIDITSATINASSTQNRTLIPNAYDTEDISYSVNTSKDFENGYTNSSSSTYAALSMKGGAQSKTWIYYLFDVSAVKDLLDYTLTSISWKATVTKSGSSSDVVDGKVQLYNGDTPLGTAQNLTTTSKVTVGDSNIGGLTWADIPNLRLKISGQRTNTNTSYTRYFYIYGADLILNYTTAPEYQTIITTQRYNGTVWVPTSLDTCFTQGSTFTIK